MNKKEEYLTTKLLTKIFELAHSEYKKIHLTESEMKSVIFSNLVNPHTTNAERNCSVKNCKNKAVKSHLFQESILRMISKESHLLSPKFNVHIGKMEIVEIGINNALTFSGFCVNHEKMFKYENNGYLKDSQDLRTLIYKCICYNQVYNDVEFKKQKSAFNSIDLKRQNKFDDKVLGKYNQLIKHLGFSEVKFEFPKIDKSSLVATKKRINKTLYFKRMIWDDITTSSNKNIESVVIEIDGRLPICFSSLGEIKLSNGHSQFQATSCLIIHPFKEKTNFIISTQSKNYHKLKKCVDGLKPEEILSLMCSALVFVSDNWLINQDFYYEDFPSEYRDMINNAVYLPLDPHNKTKQPLPEPLSQKFPKY